MRRAVGVYPVNQAGEVLLLRRNKQARHEFGKWESAGGQVEEGETFLEAAYRETREEIGVDVRRTTLLSRHASLSDETGESWQVEKYLAELDADPVIHPEEGHDEMAWVKPQDLGAYEMASYGVGDIKVLQSGIVQEFARGSQKRS